MHDERWVYSFRKGTWEKRVEKGCTCIVAEADFGSSGAKTLLGDYRGYIFSENDTGIYDTSWTKTTVKSVTQTSPDGVVVLDDDPGSVANVPILIVAAKDGHPYHYRIKSNTGATVTIDSAISSDIAAGDVVAVGAIKAVLEIGFLTLNSPLTLKGFQDLWALFETKQSDVWYMCQAYKDGEAGATRTRYGTISSQEEVIPIDVRGRAIKIKLSLFGKANNTLRGLLIHQSATGLL